MMIPGMETMQELIAVILTYNEEKHIAECIRSVTWCDAVIVIDSYSTDRTCEIARKEGAFIIRHPFKGFGSQRQAAMDCLAARWILFVDADERPTPELAREIRHRIVKQPDIVGWWFPRHNYILGKLIRHAGWYPDYQLRLLRADRSHWDPEREVHELPILDGPDGYLENVLIHYNYDSLGQFIAIQDKYTNYDAHILFQQGERPKWWSPFSMPLRHFKLRFIDWQGYKDGLYGLWLSVLMSYYEGQKYIRLARLWRLSNREPG
jgi:glycosyltransferase involved in cell wall biosynthesis